MRNLIKWLRDKLKPQDKRAELKSILKDAIDIAEAGAKGYLVGGQTGAEIAAAKELLNKLKD